MSKYSVVVSRRADEMLIRHAKFLARVSVPAAKRMVSEFELVLDSLEKNPYQYPVDEDYNLPRGMYRKALFCKWYKALFSVNNTRVFLDVVVDCWQDRPLGISATYCFLNNKKHNEGRSTSM